MKSVKVKLTDNFRPCQVLRAEIPEKVTDILVDYPITPYELAFIRTYMPNAKVRRAKKDANENLPVTAHVSSSNKITLSLIFGREYDDDAMVCFRVKSATETISIDWGDDSPIETFTVNSDEHDEFTIIEKIYEYSSKYFVTIIGDITFFDCSANVLDHLDTSQNTVLKMLDCPNNYHDLEKL